MSEIAEFCDGPWDGARRAFTGLGDMIWVTPNTGLPVMPKLERKPTAESVPYALRATARVNGCRVRYYSYAGSEYRLCGGCGVYHARHNTDGSPVSECGLCGASFSVKA